MNWKDALMELRTGSNQTKELILVIDKRFVYLGGSLGIPREK